MIPAPLHIAPSQRFRLEHYLPFLKNRGITYTVRSFWSVKAWNILFIRGLFFSKLFGLLGGLAKRCIILTKLSKYDLIFIHREAAPIGPPVFEWLIAKIWKKEIIYDFDDAIWLSTSSGANPQASLIKCSWKIKYICKYSKIVSVGNQYLSEYAQKYTRDVRIIPTVVDTEKSHIGLKNQNDSPLTIGWTGTFTNFCHLAMVNNVINALKNKYNFRYFIISDKDPQLKNVEYVYQEWNAQTEIADLLCMNIGIMPLENNAMGQGKCAFKAIQYMSLGIPAVVSPVGANCEVVMNNKNGFWAQGDEEWYHHLEKLILNKELRIQIGIEAKKFVTDNYSVKATKNLFLSLFKNE